jgi:hypothetical protein
MTFTIHQTRTTPFAEFKNGYLIIRGKSMPFNYPDIYDTIQDRMTLYMKHPEEKTRIDICLSAINASSKRSLINTFRLFEKMNKRGMNILINWFYQPDDEDVYELGEFCKSNFDLNICVNRID